MRGGRPPTCEPGARPCAGPRRLRRPAGGALAARGRVAGGTGVQPVANRVDGIGVAPCKSLEGRGQNEICLGRKENGRPAPHRKGPAPTLGHLAGRSPFAPVEAQCPPSDGPPGGVRPGARFRFRRGRAGREGRVAKTLETNPSRPAYRGDETLTAGGCPSPRPARDATHLGQRREALHIKQRREALPPLRLGLDARPRGRPPLRVAPEATPGGYSSPHVLPPKRRQGGMPPRVSLPKRRRGPVTPFASLPHRRRGPITPFASLPHRRRGQSNPRVSRPKRRQQRRAPGAHHEAMPGGRLPLRRAPEEASGQAPFRSTLGTAANVKNAGAHRLAGACRGG